MTNQPFFNHFDDPDEFWDDEPIVRNRPAVAARQSPPPARSTPIPSSPPPEPIAVPMARADLPEPPKAGSSFASIEVDRGFLPIRVRFTPGWNRYVAPNEAGNELLAAYRGAVVDRLNEAYSSAAERLPTPQEVSDTATPSRRTLLMILLETHSWDQYCAVSSSMIGVGTYTVRGRIEVGSQHPVTVEADRRYLCSISISSDWAATAHPDDIGDEILVCADQIRSLRPKFTVQYDYSRYSDDDLQYHLDRHRLQLLQERIA
ncbi:hypothetical protein [Nocardia sp. NPDC051832]|uniref:hypothetical protein n=1 Tax=Nocardia sp. NPDC051832 TaxID=3155673 RepID=UPI003416C07E